MRRAFGFWRAVELVTSRISRTESRGARSEANRTGWREGKCARNNPVIGSVGLCPARTWVCFVGDRVTNMAWGPFQPTCLGFPFFFDPIEPVKQVDWEASKAFKLGVVPLSYMSLGACLKPRSRKSNHQRPRVSQNPHSEGWAAPFRTCRCKPKQPLNKCRCKPTKMGFPFAAIAKIAPRPGCPDAAMGSSKLLQRRVKKVHMTTSR